MWEGFVACTHGGAAQLGLRGKKMSEFVGKQAGWGFAFHRGVCPQREGPGRWGRDSAHIQGVPAQNADPVVSPSLTAGLTLIPWLLPTEGSPWSVPI